MRLILFWNIFTIEARKQMSYRVDFWLNTVVGLVAGIVIPYFLWLNIYAESGQTRIGQFTFEGMLLYYIAAVLIGRVIQGPDLVQNLANDIYQGELSRYLVYPAGYLRFKYAQHLGATLPGLVQVVIFGTLFAAFLTPARELAVTPLSALCCAISVAVGNLLYFLLAYPLQAVAFWADNVWSLTVLLRFTAALLGGLFVPLSLFPEWSVEPLSYLPFSYLYWFPVQTLIGEIGFGEWSRGLGIALVWCALILVAGRRIWKRGELHYSGVGI